MKLEKGEGAGRRLTRRLAIVAVAALAGLTMPLLAPRAALAGDDLTLLEWSGYEDPEIHKAYTEKYKAEPNYSFFGDEEEAFQKVRAGFKADIMHPCVQTISRWRDADLFKPIDVSKLKNWSKLGERFRNLPDVQKDGKVWFIPADWGNTGLTYRTDDVPEADVASLQVFADPKYKGKVTIGDNVDDAYALAYLATGVKDWTKVTDEQFKAASDWLRKVHPNLRFYWSDYSSLIQSIANKEILIAWSWNDAPTKLAAAGVKAAMKKDTKEGVSTWVCGFSLLKSGEGSEQKAYDYIDSFIDDASATYLLTSWGYGHANGQAFKDADAKLLKEKGFADVDTTLGNSLFQVAMPKELREKMIAEFEKIKSGY